MLDKMRVPRPAVAMTSIRTAREAQGLTQAEIATRCGIDPVHFQMIEEGSDLAAPTLKNLQSIADALLLRVDDIR